MSTRDRHCSLF